jgi:putative effector of murein hydrolase
MKRLIIIMIGLVMLNLSLIWLHRIMFQSSEPFLIVFSVLIHLGIMIGIPYRKIFKDNTNEKR